MDNDKDKEKSIWLKTPKWRIKSEDEILDENVSPIISKIKKFFDKFLED